MRVITGIAKKKPLLTLDEECLRPTTSRVKEAMFSIIQMQIFDANVLDLFSGSGQLGIEALSRGARCCTFVDLDRKAHEIEIKNLKSTRLQQKAKVLLTDGVRFLKNTKEEYDIIFLDPPYKSNLLTLSLKLAPLKLKNNGVIVCEHPKDFNIPSYFEDVRLQKQYYYGKIGLSLYKKER